MFDLNLIVKACAISFSHTVMLKHQSNKLLAHSIHEYTQFKRLHMRKQST